jgi:3-oxoisoapionate decarboxylase
MRDSYVFNSPRGIAARWTRMGEGNIGMAQYLRNYLRQCPGKPVTIEVIVKREFRMFDYRDPDAWELFKTTPAWEFARFLALADRGVAVPPPAAAGDADERQRNLEDVEASVRWTQAFLETR